MQNGNEIYKNQNKNGWWPFWAAVAPQQRAQNTSMTCATVRLMLKSGCWWPITFENFVIVLISHVIGARSCRCPITGVRFELFVIGYTRGFHVNYAHFNSFFCNVTQFSTLLKSATDVFAQKNFPKDIFNSKICYKYGLLVIGPRIVSYNSASNRGCIFKTALRSSDFEITCTITPWVILHSV